MSLRPLALALLLLPTPTLTFAQPCPGTPLDCAVDAAIGRGLDWFRQQANPARVFAEDHPRETFLPILGLLGRRTLGGRGPVRGFLALSPDDQGRVIASLVAIIEHDPALTNPDLPPYTFGTGGNLMALSTFLATHGPDDIGAQISVSQAIGNGVLALQRIQGQPPGEAWDYNGPGVDLSATVFATSGLAAAENIIEGASARFAGLPGCPTAIPPPALQVVQVEIERLTTRHRGSDRKPCSGPAPNIGADLPRCRVRVRTSPQVLFASTGGNQRTI